MQYPDRSGWPALERRGRAPQLPRGTLKYALLFLLSERESHGYELLHKIRERKWGAPGPGSVYPLLGTLESEGLVTGRDEEGRRIYTLTTRGKDSLSEHTRSLRKLTEATSSDQQTEPVEEGEDDRLRDIAARLMQAVSHSSDSSRPETYTKICEILDRARKEIYNALAEE